MPSSVRLTRCRSRIPGGRLRRLALLPALLIAAIMWAAAPATAADPVIGAAGDIACDPIPSPPFNGGLGTLFQCRQKYTSDLLVDAQGQPTVDAVLPLGDVQYECAGLSAFNQSYGLSWGRPALKAITYPAAGNHEYDTTATSPPGSTGCDTTNDADGYFAYFGARAGDPTKGYYSYNIGAWHLIALNTNDNCLIVPCNAGSVQEQWLKADLAANPAACTLAYFHYPVFSSKTPLPQHGTAFWQALYNAGAEVVLDGHAHHYERFGPQTPAGVADPATGIREFVVGTGGRSIEMFGPTIAANSEARGGAFGILKLTLHPTGYDWQFVPDAAGATVRGTTTISADAADAGGISRVEFFIDGAKVRTDTAAPFGAAWKSTTVMDGSRTISARAFDTAGNQSTASVTVTVDNDASIYSVRTNGTGLRRLIRAPVNVDYDSPAWSGNGRRIAFSGPPCAGCPGGIFFVRAGGGPRQRLAGTVPGAGRPDWSPLDTALTFVGGPTSAVYTVRSTGTGLRRLTGGPLPHDQPAWSPDGRRIAFTTLQPNGRWDIFVMRANGAAKRNLTHSPVSDVQPAWSHDGGRIAFTRQVGAKSTLFVMTLAAGRARRVALIAGNCKQPAWSPDDRQMACTRLRTTGSHIIVMNANGARQRRLPTGTANAWAPTWSPDGQRIAFASTG